MKTIKRLAASLLLVGGLTAAASATKTRAIVESDAPGAVVLDPSLWQQFLAIAGFG